MGIHFVPSSIPSLDFRCFSVFRLPLRNLRLYFWRKAVIASALCAIPYLVSGASVTINGPTALQTSLIADTTNLYNATITPSSFFPGSYTLNLLSKKPPVICSSAPLCDLDKDIALMVANSTWNYVYGFGAGMDKERKTDLDIVSSNTAACSTNTVCSDRMTQTYLDIYQQNLSTPTVITVP